MLNRHDLIDDFVRAQIPRKPVQTARAKLAAVGATNLRRNARCPPIRFLSIQRRRRWNQNRLDQVPVAQTEKEFSSGVARSKNADDTELADAKILSELRSQRLRQITHLLKRVGTLSVKPIHNLFGTICGLGQSLKLRLKLIKQKRFDLAEVAAATSLGFPPGAMRIDVSPHSHGKAYRTAKLASNGLQVTFACCDQTHCNSSGFVSRSHIPHVGMRFTR
jgi:hypothetical protein